MEIIKEGIRMSESECPECGSVLRYWPSEVKTEMLPGRASYPFRAPVPLYDYITCPLCGERLILHRDGNKSENVCQLATEMVQLQKRKNEDYGSAFAKSFA